MSDNNKRGSALTVLLGAVAMLAAMSFVPWTHVTSGFLKDYDLLEDISDREIDRGETDEIIDPRLLDAMNADSEASDTETPADEEPPTVVEDTITGTPWQAPRIGDVVVMEDFTPQQRGLARLRNALAHSDTRPVRIGFIGDSYIEGDIFTQDVRELMQSRYGGHGVGYVPMTCETSGFRRSVRQSDEGWTDHDLRTDQSADNRWLAGQRFTSDPGATVTWRAAKRPEHATQWSQAKILYKARTGGSLSTRTDGGETATHKVAAADSVQCIDIANDGPMSAVTLTNRSVSGLTVYGVWLADSTGVTVDCMSLRGNSGITHTSLSPKLTRQMRCAGIDYDLIVLEYGLNAVSSKQKDYSYYGRKMRTVIERLRECYPTADIILMGAGDRGQKSGTAVHSMPTVQCMVNTQRDLARDMGIVFWDTRAAMGGDDAIVTWREANEVNADYIHMNFDGGRHMGRLFVDALTLSLRP